MRSLLLFFLPCLFFVSALAQETTAVLDFDTAPNDIVCGAAWVEETFSLLATNHSMGGCSFGNFNGQVFTFPGQIRVDLSGRVISQIEVDIQDFCGGGCTSAFLTQNGNTLVTLENQLVSEPETLTFDGAELANATDLRIQSFEAAIVEIRITYNELAPPGPALEILPDPAAPLGAYVLCWTDLLGSQLERSNDLQTWEPVPPAEITFVGLKATYSLAQAIANNPASNTGRFFYRVRFDENVIPSERRRSRTRTGPDRENEDGRHRGLR